MQCFCHNSYMWYFCSLPLDWRSLIKLQNDYQNMLWSTMKKWVSHCFIYLFDFFPLLYICCVPSDFFFVKIKKNVVLVGPVKGMQLVMELEQDLKVANVICMVLLIISLWIFPRIFSNLCCASFSGELVNHVL